MNNSWGFRYLAIIIFLALSVVFLTGNSVNAKTFRLTIGSGVSPDGVSAHGAFRDFFAPEVKKRVESTTKHKIEWVGGWSGSIAKIGEVLEAVQDGLLNVGMPMYLFEASKLFVHGYTIYMPFGPYDAHRAARVNWRVHERVPYLREVFEKKYNQKYLTVGVIGDYGLITTFPWKKPEDLKGRKIGAGGPNLPWVRYVGAVPVQMNYPEAYTSLQTGVYDGVIGPVGGSVGFKLNEVAPYFTHCHFGCLCLFPITVNLDTWNKLPKEIQKIMLDVGKEFPEASAKRDDELQEKALKILRSGGGHEYELPFEERGRWAKTLAGFPNKKAKEGDKRGQPGTLVMKTYMEELEKDGFKFPYRYVID